MRFRPIALALALSGAFPIVSQLNAQTVTSKTVTLDVVGAESLESLILLWTDSFRATDPTFKMNFQSTMSSNAIQALIAGQTQLAPVTRDMKPEEMSAFTTKWGYAPTRISIGMDALGILVNKSNPIKDIKLEELDAVWTTSRLLGWPKDIRVWGDLGLSGSNWANRPIHLVGHPEGSGARDFFRHVVELEGKAKPNIKRGTDVMAMIDEIISDQTAMGYASISQVYTSTRVIPVTPIGSKAPVEPIQANILNGSYPLSMFLYIYINKIPGKPLEPAIRNFLAFSLSKEGQRQVQLDGHVPLPDDLIRMNLRRIDH